ncbi:MAG: ABC transporter substrate-binding protein [Deltaproteobacteria bacterium]|nr:ABC transporter substrate-binding protein [Deltaproteobacteria bacterium]MBL7075338.1 ABC transporter substrate-binding protein [candidate division KSB1 bacterium]
MKIADGITNRTESSMGSTMLNQELGCLRKTGRLLTGLFIAVLICAFLPPAAQAMRLVFGLDTAPERLIPIKIKNPQTFPVSMQIFQGLCDLDEKGSVIPCIAESWDTKDYKTWRFHIRRGVFFQKSPIFQNGTREVTAEDVLYCLTRFCSASSYNAFLLIDSVIGAAEYNQGKAEKVKGLSLLDKYTIQIDLLRPELFFINRLSTALVSVFPREVDKKEYGEKVGLSLVVGTGPYVLQSRTETEVVLKRNDNYWNTATQPHFDEITFRVIRNDQMRLVNLQRGNIDLMVLPSSLFPSVFNRNGTLREYISKKFQMKIAATFNTHFLGINNTAIPDVNLRRAMFWGTNRKEIIDTILYGYADLTGGPVPPGIDGYKSPFTDSLFDPDKAKAYLKRSNYRGEPLELLLYDIANSEQVGQIFQAQMANVGIQVVLKKLDFNSVINRMVKGECQLFSMFAEYVFSSPQPILINLFSSSKIPVPNVFHFSNSAVDAMLNSLYTITNEKESVRECSRIVDRIMQGVPGVFLYRQKYVILYPKEMTGLEVSGNNHYFLEKMKIGR